MSAHLRPQRIRFCFTVKSVRPDSQHPKRWTSADTNYWLPPKHCNGFEVTNDSEWHYWNNGIIKPVPQSSTRHIQPFQSSSIVWCHERQAYLHVPFDCTEYDVGQAPEAVHDEVELDWKRLNFLHEHVVGNDYISLLRYHAGNNELAGVGSPDWVPQLLPGVYQPATPGLTDRRSHLGGSLSLILGLAAFSAEADAAIETIGRSFRCTLEGTRWVTHSGQGEGRVNERVVVVQIGTIPGICNSTEVLTSWEEGRWGPIIPYT